MNATSTTERCTTWAEHEFGPGVLVGAGRHPVQGAWHRYRLTCGRCGRTTIETRWVRLPDYPERQRAED